MCLKPTEIYAVCAKAATLIWLETFDSEYNRRQCSFCEVHQTQSAINTVKVRFSKHNQQSIHTVKGSQSTINHQSTQWRFTKHNQHNEGSQSRTHCAGCTKQNALSGVVKAERTIWGEWSGMHRVWAQPSRTQFIGWRKPQPNKFVPGVVILVVVYVRERAHFCGPTIERAVKTWTLGVVFNI